MFKEVIELGKKINIILKRCIDVVTTALILITLSPLLLLTSIIIKISMPGPIFFLQERIGRNHKKFSIYKFRSMKVDYEAERNFEFDKDQYRITKFGNLIRRLKIDELPQLLNVLNGDMSLVGPRPTIEEQTLKYNDEQKQRLNMRPGMTGLAQVNGNTSLSWEERISYDLKYIKSFSVYLDMKILFKTALIVIFGEEKFKKSI